MNYLQKIRCIHKSARLQSNWLKLLVFIPVSSAFDQMVRYLRSNSIIIKFPYLNALRTFFFLILKISLRFDFYAEISSLIHEQNMRFAQNRSFELIQTEKNYCYLERNFMILIKMLNYVMHGLLSSHFHSSNLLFATLKYKM